MDNDIHVNNKIFGITFNEKETTDQYMMSVSTEPETISRDIRVLAD